MSRSICASKSATLPTMSLWSRSPIVGSSPASALSRTYVRSWVKRLAPPCDGRPGLAKYASAATLRHSPFGSSSDMPT